MTITSIEKFDGMTILLTAFQTRVQKRPQKYERIRKLSLRRFYFSFVQNFTHNAFWFFGDTQGARFYDMHGTTLHLFVILFPLQYMGKGFAVETRAF